MNNTNNPLISIFVPTKNRYRYLKYLIELVESFKDWRVELVIHDNSEDNSEILDYMKGQDYVSTRYYYNSSFLSMSENSNFAFSKCRGEYVCMIGDDDAVCRNIGDCVEWMKEQGIDALRSVEAQFVYEDNNTLLYYGDVRPVVHYYSPIDELKKILRRGLPDFGLIPKPYQGIVRRSVMQKILDIDGTCFPGCTPDMSGAVAATFFTKSFVIIDIPVIISGLSNMNSGGLAGQILNLDQVPWIDNKTRTNWEVNIPRIWAREFIWPESASKALRYTKHEDFLQYMNYGLMKCRYLVMHKQHRKEVINSFPSKVNLLYSMFIFLFTVGSKLFFNRVILKFFNKKLNGVYNYCNNIRDIIGVEQFFYNRGYYVPFKDLIKK